MIYSELESGNKLYLIHTVFNPQPVKTYTPCWVDSVTQGQINVSYEKDGRPMRVCLSPYGKGKTWDYTNGT